MHVQRPYQMHRYKHVRGRDIDSSGVSGLEFYTPLQRATPKDVMESLSPMGRPSTVKDIMDAVMYLTDAATVTGDILYVDGGSHFGRW